MSNPYRFSIPRPDPTPTKTSFKETFLFYWQRFLKWGDKNPDKWFSGVFALVIICGTVVFVPIFYMEQMKTYHAAQAWAQQHDGRVLFCHRGANNFFCSVRTPHDDYRIIYDGIGETEPYIITKEIP